MQKLNIPRQNQENHKKKKIFHAILKKNNENLIIPRQNHENLKFLEFHARIMKIMKI